MQPNENFSFAHCRETADWLLAHSKQCPKIAIICGSRLGPLEDSLMNPVSFRYADIPNFPRCTVKGHDGHLVFGELQGKLTVCMRGRFHVYEGYPLWQTCECLNARISRKVTSSSLSLTVNGRFGPHFLALLGAYNRQLCALAMETARCPGYASFARQGVDCVVGGPGFESVAEAWLLQMLGADAVGMSTAAEVLVARHCGLRVFGLSLITGQVRKDYNAKEPTDHQGVLEASQRRVASLQALLAGLVGGLDCRSGSTTEEPKNSA
ncbi:purine nucleoside phosphorylase-like [Candoia aspera]|uniref:purine nucleoside phosphorylase-like n=1 Tax=Candoia aspera TaxID=51853 RepID=UPI002FD84DCC